MRTSMAYLAGAGTVIVAMAAGLGGGLVFSNIVSPHDRDMGKVERRAVASQQAEASPAEPSAQTTVGVSRSPSAPNSYLAQVQPAATAPVTISPAPTSAPATTPTSDKAASANNDKPETAASVASAPAAADPKPVETTQSTQPASPSRAVVSSPDNAYAKARDADLKQFEARKKADRRQQWAARHQQQQQLREQDARQPQPDVRDARDVREDPDRPREIIVRRDVDDTYDRDRSGPDSPMPFGLPRINLFGSD